MVDANGSSTTDYAQSDEELNKRDRNRPWLPVAVALGLIAFVSLSFWRERGGVLFLIMAVGGTATYLVGGMRGFLWKLLAVLLGLLMAAAFFVALLVMYQTRL